MKPPIRPQGVAARSSARLFDSVSRGNLEACDHDHFHEMDGIVGEINREFTTAGGHGDKICMFYGQTTTIGHVDLEWPKRLGMKVSSEVIRFHTPQHTQKEARSKRRSGRPLDGKFPNSIRLPDRFDAPARRGPSGRWPFYTKFPGRWPGLRNHGLSGLAQDTYEHELD